MINQTLSKSKTFPLQMTLKKMKRQATGWTKVFANHISHEGFVSRRCKQPSKINSKKTIKNGQKT